MSDAEFGTWIAAFLIAKGLREVLDRVLRGKTLIVLSYVIGIPIIAVVAHLDLLISGLLAIANYLWLFRRRHILAIINHTFLESVMLVVIVVLRHEPEHLVSVLQLLFTSVWIYSVWQKLYHREFADGLVFYGMFAEHAERWRLFRWLLPDIRPLPATYGALIPGALARCRQIAWLCMLGEMFLPLAALALSGSPLGVLCMLALIVPVGVISDEWDFMYTNAILTVSFFSAFQISDVLAAAEQHVVIAVILGWAAFWPIVHAILVRHFRISSWRLFGWGMYATTDSEVYEISSEGELRAYRGRRTGVLSGFGGCRIPAMRRLALRACLAPSGALREGVVAIDVVKLFRVDRTVVSRHTVLVPGRDAIDFDIRNDADRRAFMEYVLSLCRRTPAERPGPRLILRPGPLSHVP
jgi:hypothetical protein